MKKIVTLILILAILGGAFSACKTRPGESAKPEFITISGPDLLTPDGEKFLIKGINLGNWLNPEGYMFRFQRTSSGHLIDQAFRELVGPDFTNEFWTKFKDNYITREDINYIKSTGMNSIRLPFHYKLFTGEDFVNFRDSVNLPIYMGETGENSDQWIAAWTRLMVKNNIGYHYWPYKKMGRPSCLVTIPTPENWDSIVAFTEKPRLSYKEIREARPDQALVRKAMLDLAENCKFQNCTKNEGYIRAMGMTP